ncbi:MAG: magnesium transporter CorA family protein [Verrucomicrobiota bacterium]
MIRSYVFNQGKLVGQDLDIDSLKLVLHDKGLQVWVDMEAPTDAETKSILEDVFSYHPLAIEDCLTLSDRPKVDEYEDYLFLVIHAVDCTKGAQEFRTTELDIFMGKDYLVTFHRDPLRSITATIDRVMKNAPALARAPDRLTHTILDQLFDYYQPVLDELSAGIAELEEEMFTTKPSTEILAAVVRTKKQVTKLLQIVAPQREVIARFGRGEFKFVRAHLVPYYRDLFDALARITGRAEGYRESLNTSLDVHLNLQQMQVNQIIKVLTVLATLSLPIVVVTTYYGMNFHLPEYNLSAPLAILWVFGISGACTFTLFLWLKRKGWL